ncbi:MAG: outer membrane protein OmpK [Pseudomonadota bacterium]
MNVNRSAISTPRNSPVSTAVPRTLLKSLLLLAGFMPASFAMAGAATWSSTNVQYLSGSAYESIFFNPVKGALDSTEESASILTVEHVNEWKYGDNFFFADVTNPDRNGGSFATSYYGEFSPRLSMGKISGKGVGTGLIKDVLVTTTAEIGQGFHTYLYGLAVDLNLPNTPVFQINYYARNETTPGSDMGSQLTLVWLKPFTIGELDFTFEGFFDYAFGMDHAEDNIITAPRLLFDLGDTWGAPGLLQVGVEYQIWRNKFGLDSIDEDVVQAMVKWTW